MQFPLSGTNFEGRNESSLEFGVSHRFKCMIIQLASYSQILKLVLDEEMCRTYSSIYTTKPDLKASYFGGN